MLLIAAVALLGFLSGHHASHHVEAIREASVPEGSFSYPTALRWRAASGASAPAALAITQQAALAPGGDSSRGALIVGQLPSETGLLPTAFLAQLRTPPQTRVAYLGETEAFQYSKLALSGYDRPFTLYVVPNATPPATAIICSAPAAASLQMRECEAIAAGFSSSRPGLGTELIPVGAYAHALSNAIDGFDRLRASLRPRISPGAPAAQVHDVALRLAAGAAGAASSIARVTAPAVAGRAQAALASALVQTAGAYSRLAAAVAKASTINYTLARTGVDTAEKRVDAALLNLALLGYDHT